MPGNSALPRALARAHWLDSAKGLGIILVVYGHAARALYAGVGAPPWVRSIDQIIYAFHMPLFFLVAGLFVWSSLGKGRLHFVGDKLRTIIYPYILWSFIEGGLELFFAKDVNSPISWRDLTMIPIIPIEQFWFLYVMAFCLLLALACYPNRSAVALVAVAGLFVDGKYGAGSMVLRTLAFFPYLAVGILFAESIRALGANRRKAGIVLVGSAVIFSAGILARWDGVIGNLVVALAGSCLTLAAAALMASSITGVTLALLGRASLAIYVMHTIFSAGLRIFVKLAGIVVPTSAMLLVTTAVGLVCPLCVWLGAERWGLTLPFGLGRAMRRTGRGGGVLDGFVRERSTQ